MLSAIFSLTLLGQLVFGQPQSELQSSLHRLEMMQLLNGANVEGQLSRLPKWLEKNFFYRVRCADSLFDGISQLQCLYGMRTVAEAMIQGQLPRPKEAVIIEINDRWQRMNMTKLNALIRVPYSAPATIISNYVKRDIGLASYAQRLRLLEEIEELRLKVERKSGKEIIIDERLENLKAAAGLYLLDLFLSSNGEFPGLTESVTVSDGFRLPYEDALRLNEDIDASASLQQLRSYLSLPERTGFGRMEAWPHTFFTERNKLQKAKEEFSKKYSVAQIVCSPSAELPQMVCRQALERLGHLAEARLIKLPPIDRIGIAAAGEMPVVADYFRDPHEGKHVMLIRSDFGPSQMVRYFVDMGWASQTTIGGTK